MRFLRVTWCLIVCASASALAEEEIRMTSGANLSPDGGRIAFSWRGDIWTVSSRGGVAGRLTTHPAPDGEPHYSPDGSEIAFTSERSAGRQVFVMPAEGGAPRQQTFDTNGFSLMGWFPDGKSLLVRGRSDRFWRKDLRFFRIPSEGRAAPAMLFDAYGVYADVSPDGTRVLFTREGAPWWRKGYRGSQASQIWLYDLRSGTFSKVLQEPAGCRWPVWLPDGRSFLYVGGESGSLNLTAYHLDDPPAGGPKRQLTHFPDDSVIVPTVSGDGEVVVFRHLFDLYRFRPGADRAPVRLRIVATGDEVSPRAERKVLEKADEASFSADGLEVAFTAGGDLWVMDTVLREPVRILETPEEERDPVLTPDGSAILFVSDQFGQSDIWRAERADAGKWWWRNEGFRVTRVTDDPVTESGLSVSPDGSRIAFVRGRGDLVTALPDGGGETILARSANGVGYDWSPDGRFLAYAVEDPDSNRDVWIVPVDDSSPAVNVSRHPYDDRNPAWSPDGKILAYVGRRRERESDIFYVWLRKADEEETKWDRTLAKALEKMAKSRKPKAGSGPEKGSEGAGKGEEKEPAEEAAEASSLLFDLDAIHERVRRLRTRDVSERDLFWSHDGEKLAFSATVDGKRGTYTVSFPQPSRPSLLTTTTGSGAAWVETGNRILWLVGGVPASTVGTKTTKFAFSVRTVVDRRERLGVGFDLAWRWMRDWFYDGNLNHRDWDAIHRKYRETASRAPDASTFARIVSLMLGELNASHLGFHAFPDGAAWSPDQWSVATGHLGLLFETDHPGPGLRVADVVPGGPADLASGGVAVGETVREIDGVAVGPGVDLTTVLNGPPGRKVELTVRDGEEEERQVGVQPVSLGVIHGLLYRRWIRDNRKKVEELSKGRLGYLHVRGMNWPSFEEFEGEIYAEGCGKQGLVIDVRENSGGFTADHLLTILCQPAHAMTMRRDAEPGYPQDRMVYARWRKPIVVLVNQGSFSNAEIFAHAVKTIGRGRIVGVPSAGGVISTSSRRILDIGRISVPLRGWFLIESGEDLERNGVVPHRVVWPWPGEMPAGKDRQLETAVEVLEADVAEWEARPRPRPRKASER